MGSRTETIARQHRRIVSSGLSTLCHPRRQSDGLLMGLSTPGTVALTFVITEGYGLCRSSPFPPQARLPKSLSIAPTAGNTAKSSQYCRLPAITHALTHACLAGLSISVSSSLRRRSDLLHMKPPTQRTRRTFNNRLPKTPGTPETLTTRVCQAADGVASLRGVTEAPSCPQIGVGGFEFGVAERRYIEQVLDSNRLSYGPMTQRFEREFAEPHGCKHGLFCNSGTSALHMAVAVLKERGGWQDDDEVLVPAITFIATSNVVLHCRLKPVFVDVERDTYNMDPAEIEARITPRTRAIIPVHLFGQPAGMTGIMDVARKHGLAVVEDSAETMFAEYKGQPVGSFGDIGCFSTYVAHVLVTGVGGFATTNDDELATMLRSWMNHGRDPGYTMIDDDKNKRGDELRGIVNRRFRFVRLGHSFRATELEAAIGLGQLEQAHAFLDRRRAIARRYTEGLADLSDRLQLPICRDDRTHSYMMYAIVLRDEPKWDLVHYLEEQHVETREMMPLLDQSIYRDMFGDIEDEYPIAKWINKSGLYIGCHPFLSDNDVDHVIEHIHAFFRR